MKRDIELGDEDEDGDEAEAEEPEADIDSSEFFCRFTPMQIDRMAEAWLGERPLCERWISRDGKTAVLHGLRIKTAKRKHPDELSARAPNMVERWKQRFQKTTS